MRVAAIDVFVVGVVVEVVELVAVVTVVAVPPEHADTPSNNSGRTTRIPIFTTVNLPPEYTRHRLKPLPDEYH